MDALAKTEKSKYALELELLKIVSRSWNALEWEAYLGTLEQPLKEELFAFEDENVEPSTWPVEASAKVRMLVRMSLKSLSKNQQLVIRKIFFQGMTERQAAESMGISRTTVMNHKRRAIRKLKFNLQKLSSNFAISEDQENFDQGECHVERG